MAFSQGLLRSRTRSGVWGPITSTSTASAGADPAVPIDETIGAIAEMIQAGFVRQVGLSETGAETLRRAQTVHPIADLQIALAGDRGRDPAGMS